MINLSSIVHWMDVICILVRLGLFSFLCLYLFFAFFLSLFWRAKITLSWTTKTWLRNTSYKRVVSVQQLCHYVLKHKNLSEIYTNCTWFVFVWIKKIAMIFILFSIASFQFIYDWIDGLHGQFQISRFVAFFGHNLWTHKKMFGFFTEQIVITITMER